MVTEGDRLLLNFELLFWRFISDISVPKQYIDQVVGHT